jgi:hypothetical protein
MVRPYSLPEDWADDFLSRIRAEMTESTQHAATMIEEAQVEIGAIEAKLKRLKLMLLDELIGHDEARRDRAEMLSDKKTFEDHIAAIETKPDGWLEQFRDWVSEAQRVGEIAVSDALTERAALAKKIFGSNLVLAGKKARGVAVNPWALIPGDTTGITCVSLYYRARTHFQKHGSSPEVRTGGDSNPFSG